jgi:hypothetical protein
MRPHAYVSVDDGVGELSGIFGEAWALYRRWWLGPAALALLAFAAVAAIGAAAYRLGPRPGITIAFAVGLAGCLVVQSALAPGIADMHGDENVRPALARSLRDALPRLGAAMAAAVAVSVAFIAGFALFVLPGFLVLTWLAFAVPATVLDDLPVRPALAHSRRLVGGHASNVFGMVLVSLVIAVAASPLFAVAFLWLAEGPRVAAAVALEGGVVVPYISAAWTLAYLRLRPESAPEEDAQKTGVSR